MVEPVAFGFNEETAANNYFQQRTVAAGETVQACALKEFRGMVDKLRANGIEVIAVQDTPIPHTPDSIFPNNWVSFHDDGTGWTKLYWVGSARSRILFRCPFAPIRL